MPRKRKKTNKDMIEKRIKEMIDQHTGPGPLVGTTTASQLSVLTATADVINGRGSDKLIDQTKFEFSSNGRFDSFTKACGDLGQAETRYGFSFSTQTDHLFLYTKLTDIEGSINDGFAIFIRDARLFYFSAHREQQVPSRHERLRKGQVFEIEPQRLLTYLNGANRFLADNTVPEQMKWVQEAQRRGLIAPEYPSYKIGLTAHGQGPWLALESGATEPKGFVFMPHLN